MTHQWKAHKGVYGQKKFDTKFFAVWYIKRRVKRDEQLREMFRIHDLPAEHVWGPYPP